LITSEENPKYVSQMCNPNMYTTQNMIPHSLGYPGGGCHFGLGKLCSHLCPPWWPYPRIV